MARPTIAVLEEILRSGQDIPLQVLPNGEVLAQKTELIKCPKCKAIWAVRALEGNNE